MKISILIPTNRTSYSAVARVLEVASLDPQRFEVIVRNNSQDERKQRLLDQVKTPTVQVLHVPNLGANENLLEALRLATGDFVLYLADDDWLSVKALLHLHEVVSAQPLDDSISLLTGAYFIEISKASGYLKYSGIDSFDAVERLKGYIEANGPNVLYYSAVRRSLLTFCFQFVQSMPYKFSFHDILMVLLYLSVGRSKQIDRVLYFYDQTDWETKEGTLAKDRAWYIKAGLPIELDRLHWLICGLEGVFALNSRLFAAYSTYDRQAVTQYWFSAMFHRFKHWDRDIGWQGTPTNEAARKLREKLLAHPDVNMNELLMDISDVIELTDPDGAARYFEFWSSI